MTFKEITLKTLAGMANQVNGHDADVIGRCMEAVREIPQYEHENVPVSAPNYEAMYQDAMKKLDQTRKELDACMEVNRYLRSENERLTGFREAVKLIFENNQPLC